MSGGRNQQRRPAGKLRSPHEAVAWWRRCTALLLQPLVLQSALPPPTCQPLADWIILHHSCVVSASQVVLGFFHRMVRAQPTQPSCLELAGA